ncbi:MAG: alpha/beta hydrolase [Candidatus Thorarchaeota archaeon]|nr:alpha/beta hydrolase [Candidatus Thorarchaeota archaeon]
MPFVETNGVRTYYELEGAGPPIVFIHGAACDRDMWRPQVEYFADKCSVITYDLRGHGKSQGSDGRYSCRLFADDLNALLQSLDVREPVICGISLGGMVAQEYTVRYQQNLRGLVLADTAVSTTLRFSDRVQKALFPKRLVLWMVRNMSRKRYADFSFRFFKMAPSVREYLVEKQLAMSQEELLKVIEAAYDFELLDLASVSVPTLVIIGENERKSVFPHAEKMLQLISNSRKVVIPGAGHASNLENPMGFNRALEKFLSELPSPRAT